MKQKKHGLRQTLSIIFRRIQIYSSHIFFGTATTQKRLLTNQLYVRLTLGRQQVSIHVSHHNMAWLYPDISNLFIGPCVYDQKLSVYAR